MQLLADGSAGTVVSTGHTVWLTTSNPQPVGTEWKIVVILNRDFGATPLEYLPAFPLPLLPGQIQRQYNNPWTNQPFQIARNGTSWFDGFGLPMREIGVHVVLLMNKSLGQWGEVARVAVQVNQTLTSFNMAVPASAVAGTGVSMVIDARNQFGGVMTPVTRYYFNGTEIASPSFVLPLYPGAYQARAVSGAFDRAAQVAATPRPMDVTASANQTSATTCPFPVSLQCAASGGTGVFTYQWSMTTPTNGATLIMNPANGGAANVTVTASRRGVYQFNVAVHDDATPQQVVNRTVSVNVDAPAVALGAVTATRVAQPPYPYVFNLTSPVATGGVGTLAYQWSVESTGTAAGATVTFDNAASRTTSATVSGAGGPYVFKMTATDAAMGTATALTTPISIPTVPVSIGAPSYALTTDKKGVTLMVRGSGGLMSDESKLVYRWTVTSSPTLLGRESCVFTANNQNASATATFLAAGDYTFAVYANDTVQQTINSETKPLAVHVPQVAGGDISVEPVMVFAQPGSTVNFAAKLLDQFGAVLSDATGVTWTCGAGGSMSGGVMTIGRANTSGSSIVVTAAAAGKTAQGTVRIGGGTDATVAISGGSGAMNYPLRLLPSAGLQKIVVNFEAYSVPDGLIIREVGGQELGHTGSTGYSAIPETVGGLGSQSWTFDFPAFSVPKDLVFEVYGNAGGTAWDLSIKWDKTGEAPFEIVTTRYQTLSDRTYSVDATYTPTFKDVTYQWSVSGPTGSHPVFDDATDDNPTLTVDRVGDYRVELVLSDKYQPTIKTDMKPMVVTCDPKISAMAWADRLVLAPMNTAVPLNLSFRDQFGQVVANSQIGSVLISTDPADQGAITGGNGSYTYTATKPIKGCLKPVRVTATKDSGSAVAILTVCEPDNIPTALLDDPLMPPGAPRNSAPTHSPDPVVYATGEVVYQVTDLETPGFAFPGITRSLSQRSFSAGPVGDGWIIDQLPAVRLVPSARKALVNVGGVDTRVFTETGAQGSGIYVGSRYLGDFEGLKAVGDDLVLADGVGNRQVFYGFTAAVPPALQGRLKRMIDAGGVTTQVTYNGSNQLASMVRLFTDAGGTPVRQAVNFAWYAGASLLQSVSWQVTRGSSAVVVRQVAYDYYPRTNAITDDLLRSVRILDGQGVTLEASGYRYWTTEPVADGCQPGMLKYVISPRAWARMVAASIDPLAASDASVASYATKHFAYNADRRVVRQVLRGEDVDASGTWTYAYRTSSFPSGPENWMTETIETLPDGSVTTVYSNAGGQTLLLARREPGANAREWVHAYRYDGAGRETWHATPSALAVVNGASYNAALADLGIGTTNGPSAGYVRASAGLIHVTQYYSATTAAVGGIGGRQGFVQHRMVKEGDTGTPQPVQTLTYQLRREGQP